MPQMVIKNLGKFDNQGGAATQYIRMEQKKQYLVLNEGSDNNRVISAY